MSGVRSSGRLKAIRDEEKERIPREVDEEDELSFEEITTRLTYDDENLQSDEDGEGYEGDEGDAAVVLHEDASISTGAWTVYTDTDDGHCNPIWVKDVSFAHANVFPLVKKIATGPKTKDKVAKDRLVHTNCIAQLARATRDHDAGNFLLVQVLFHVRLRSSVCVRKGVRVLGPTNSTQQFRSVVKYTGTYYLVSTGQLLDTPVTVSDWKKTVHT